MFRSKKLVKIMACIIPVSIVLTTISTPDAHAITGGLYPAANDPYNRAVVRVNNFEVGSTTGNFCTGTIVSNPEDVNKSSQWIVTARHCLMKNGMELKSQYTDKYNISTESITKINGEDGKPFEDVKKTDPALVNKVSKDIKDVQSQQDFFGMITPILAGIAALAAGIPFVIYLINLSKGNGT